MLKRLAVFAMCVPLAAVGILAGQDTQKGTPKEGIAKANSGQGGTEQPHTQGSKQAPPNAVTIADHPAATTCDEACQQGRENLKIQGELALFTGLLVAVGILEFVVGAFQVLLLGFTWKTVRNQLKEMKRQADSMETQAQDARESNAEATRIALATAKAAQTSANAAKDQIEMMKEKERARIQVIPLSFELVNPNEPEQIAIDFVNIGPTSAFNARVDAGARVLMEGFETQQGEYTDLAIPTLLKPDKTESSWVVWEFPRRWMDEVVDAKVKIIFELIGQIKYRDIFGTNYTEDFSYRMNVYGFEILPNGFIRLKLMRNWHPFEPRPGDWEF
jgi:hypothetical protein